MALQHTGRDIALERDPLSGKYDLVFFRFGTEQREPGSRRQQDPRGPHEPVESEAGIANGIGSQGVLHDPTGPRESPGRSPRQARPSQLRSYGEDVGSGLNRKQIRTYRISASRMDRESSASTSRGPYRVLRR